MDWSGRKARRTGSHGYFRLEAAAGAAQDVGASYQTPALVAAGAQAQEVSVLSGLTNLIAAFLCTRVPSLIGNLGSRKKAVLFLALLDSITWLPLIAVMFFAGPAVVPNYLAALWIASAIPGRLLLPARDSWFADTVPAGSMGRQFGLRAAISAVAYLGVFYLMVRLLGAFSTDVFKGFAVVCLAAFLASLVKTMSYRQINDVEILDRRARFGFSDFVEDTKRYDLGKFVIYICLFNLAVYLCSPLFAVYMVESLKLSPMAFAILISSEFIARAVSAGLWGRYSDDSGALPDSKKGLLSHTLDPHSLACLIQLAYLVFIQVFSGIIWAGFDVCSQSLIYRVIPQEDRTKYVSYQNSMITLSRAGGALLGAGTARRDVPDSRLPDTGAIPGLRYLPFCRGQGHVPRMKRVGQAFSTCPVPNFAEVFKDKRGPAGDSPE